VPDPWHGLDRKHLHIGPAILRRLSEYAPDRVPRGGGGHGRPFRLHLAAAPDAAQMGGAYP
jgi:hypothetical protein